MKEVMIEKVKIGWKTLPAWRLCMVTLMVTLTVLAIVGLFMIPSQQREKVSFEGREYAETTQYWQNETFVSVRVSDRVWKGKEGWLVVYNRQARKRHAIVEKMLQDMGYEKSGSPTMKDPHCRISLEDSPGRIPATYASCNYILVRIEHDPSWGRKIKAMIP
jgi:hypothetical protein